MRGATLSFLLSLAACGTADSLPGGTSGAPAPLLITCLDQRESAVGQPVTLRGVVTNSKIATLMGVDIESSSPDLRGKPATASGCLKRVLVTQDRLDREEKESGGIFAHRPAGTYYRLEDATGRLVQVQPAPGD